MTSGIIIINQDKKTNSTHSSDKIMLTFICSHPWISLVLAASLGWKLAPLFTSKKNIWTGEELNWVEKMVYGGIAAFARDWNDYEVHDLDRLIQNKENCLLIGYHSRTTLDLIYLTATIHCHVLVTHLLFYIPIIGTVLPLLGIISSKGGVRDRAEEAFIETLSRRERPLMLLPGGAFECMKAYHHRYRVMWKEVPGFARVIHDEERLQKHTKVIPFYTKNSELSLWTVAWWYTQSGRGVWYLMNAFRDGQVATLPVMMVLLLFSLGFFPLPSPVKLDTFFGSELVLQDNETAQAFALRVKTELHSLIDRVNGLPERPRRRQSAVYFLFLGVFTLAQNLIVHSIGISTLLLLLYPLLLAVQMVMRCLSKERREKVETEERETAIETEREKKKVQ